MTSSRGSLPELLWNVAGPRCKENPASQQVYGLQYIGERPALPAARRTSFPIPFDMQDGAAPLKSCRPLADTPLVPVRALSLPSRARFEGASSRVEVRLVLSSPHHGYWQAQGEPATRNNPRAWPRGSHARSTPPPRSAAALDASPVHGWPKDARGTRLRSWRQEVTGDLSPWRGDRATPSARGAWNLFFHHHHLQTTASIAVVWTPPSSHLLSLDHHDSGHPNTSALVAAVFSFRLGPGCWGAWDERNYARGGRDGGIELGRTGSAALAGRDRDAASIGYVVPLAASSAASPRPTRLTRGFHAREWPPCAPGPADSAPHARSSRRAGLLLRGAAVDRVGLTLRLKLCARPRYIPHALASPCCRCCPLTPRAAALRYCSSTPPFCAQVLRHRRLDLDARAPRFSSRPRPPRTTPVDTKRAVACLDSSGYEQIVPPGPAAQREHRAPSELVARELGQPLLDARTLTSEPVCSSARPPASKCPLASLARRATAPRPWRQFYLSAASGGYLHLPLPPRFQALVPDELQLSVQRSDCPAPDTPTCAPITPAADSARLVPTCATVGVHQATSSVHRRGFAFGIRLFAPSGPTARREALCLLCFVRAPGCLLLPLCMRSWPPTPSTRPLDPGIRHPRPDSPELGQPQLDACTSTSCARFRPLSHVDPTRTRLRGHVTSEEAPRWNRRPAPASALPGARAPVLDPDPTLAALIIRLSARRPSPALSSAPRTTMQSAPQRSRRNEHTDNSAPSSTDVPDRARPSAPPSLPCTYSGAVPTAEEGAAFQRCHRRQLCAHALCRSHCPCSRVDVPHPTAAGLTSAAHPRCFDIQRPAGVRAEIADCVIDRLCPFYVLLPAHMGGTVLISGELARTAGRLTSTAARVKACGAFLLPGAEKTGGQLTLPGHSGICSVVEPLCAGAIDRMPSSALPSGGRQFQRDVQRQHLAAVVNAPRCQSARRTAPSLSSATLLAAHTSVPGSPPPVVLTGLPSLDTAPFRPREKRSGCSHHATEYLAAVDSSGTTHGRPFTLAAAVPCALPRRALLLSAPPLALPPTPPPALPNGGLAYAIRVLSSTALRACLTLNGKSAMLSRFREPSPRHACVAVLATSHAPRPNAPSCASPQVGSSGFAFGVYNGVQDISPVAPLGLAARCEHRAPSAIQPPSLVLSARAHSSRWLPPSSHLRLPVSSATATAPASPFYAWVPCSSLRAFVVWLSARVGGTVLVSGEHACATGPLASTAPGAKAYGVFCRPRVAASVRAEAGSPVALRYTYTGMNHSHGYVPSKAFGSVDLPCRAPLGDRAVAISSRAADGPHTCASTPSRPTGPRHMWFTPRTGLYLGPPSLCVPMVAPNGRSRPACPPRLDARGVNAPGPIGLTPTPPISTCRTGSPQHRLAAPRAASVRAGPFSATSARVTGWIPRATPCLLRKTLRAPRTTAVAREPYGPSHPVLAMQDTTSTADNPPRSGAL
ncbi:hypothetical protein B0H14DRAFT_3862702 [Mycena olivaceomarginata]|nr:hypothetical protein B0H14DRAFT_3862702 [Mycena olivaceomarginata]